MAGAKPSVRGSLAFTPSTGISLELVGSAMAVSSASEASERGMVTLHGRTDHGDLVTLSDAFVSSLPFSLATYQILQSFTVNEVVFGVHSPSVSGLPVEAIRFELTQIPAWIGRAVDKFLASSSPRAAAASVQLFSLAVAGMQATLECTLVARRHSTSESVGWSVVPVFTIAADRSYPLAWFKRHMWRLKELLALLMASPVHLQAIEALHQGKWLDVLVVPGASVAPAGLARDSVLAPYEAIKAVWPEILNRYFNEAEGLADPIELLAGTHYERRSRPLWDFLSLMHSIESLLRWSFAGESLPQAKFSEFLSKFKPWLESEVSDTGVAKDWFNRMRFANQPTLRNRFKRLPSQLPPNAVASLGLNEHRFHRFVDLMVNTRNYRTHYDPSSKGKVLEDEELIEVNWWLYGLGVLLVFRALGLPGLLATGLVDQNADLEWWLRKARKRIASCD